MGMTRKVDDLTGMQVNLLTVIKRVDDWEHPNGTQKIDRWLCKCDCGKTKIVYGRRLRNKDIKSCGCIKPKNPHYIDWTGHMFGKFTVIKQVEKPATRKNNGTYWLCKCSCGNERIMISADIKRQHTLSCGKCPKNTYDISGTYGIGWSVQKRLFLFDKDDYDLIRKYNWCHNTQGYLVSFDTKTKKFIYLHRLIMGVSNSKQVVDHINHHTYDNRKENLRVCSQRENIMNCKVGKNNTSGITGVMYHQLLNKWYASITIHSRTINLGYYEKIEDAIKARKNAEQQYFGNFAYNEHERKAKTMITCNMMLYQDFYKISHCKNMYPQNTNKLYATWTPRSNKYFPESKSVVWFGFQGFITKYLIEWFDKYFFEQDINDIVSEYQTYIHNTFDEEAIISHIVELHELGYLPLEIKSLPEGSLVPYGIPCATFSNTHPNFAWLVNFMETLVSCNMWLPTTTATTAYLAREINEKYIRETSDLTNIWENCGCGDFSFRGMASLDAAIVSGAAFLTSFTKTSTIPAIKYICDYYQGNVKTDNIGSWNASVEHSCTALNYAIDHDEKIFFHKMITELYPDKPFSFVADTYNYWKFFDVIQEFKDDIMSHNGCIRIRPDSGDPFKIICGDPKSENYRIKQGSLRLLWEIFGGTINSKGYKVLHPSIGLVYGDSIRLETHHAICEEMKKMGFAIENVVFGYGSYSMQYKTRDTQGWAYKITYAEVNNQPLKVFKDPITSDGFKKSQKGLCRVYEDADGILQYEDGFLEEPKDSLLQTIFSNGKLINPTSLKEIRYRLHKGEF